MSENEHPEHPGPPERTGRPRPERRRRRTALVTSRWVASAAVVAAMTASGAQAADPDGGTDPEATTAFADPPEEFDG